MTSSFGLFLQTLLLKVFLRLSINSCSFESLILLEFLTYHHTHVPLHSQSSSSHCYLFNSLDHAANTEKLVTTLLDGLYPVEDLLPKHMCDLHIETELKRDNLSFGYEQFL